jgi:hypothetical protein
MDMTNNISQSILKSSNNSYGVSSYSTSNDRDFFGMFSNINGTTWILIIVILAFLGFNIFIYLAKGTENITNFFTPFLEKIIGTSVATTEQIVDVSAEGAKSVVSETSDATESSLTALQDVTPNLAKSKNSLQPINEPQTDIVQQSSLNKALNTSQEQKQIYLADSASSSIQGGGKSGWCYIGEDRGFRACSEVGVNDSCMSGDIFPTQEICLNPKLRT